jgi:hypothetical protein
MKPSDAELWTVVEHTLVHDVLPFVVDAGARRAVISLIGVARAWPDGDPDERHRDELVALIGGPVHDVWERAAARADEPAVRAVLVRQVTESLKATDALLAAYRGTW